MRTKHYFKLLAAIFLLITFGACSNDDVEIMDPNSGIEKTTKATSPIWVRASSHTSGSISFTVNEKSTVTMTVYVSRGFNQWSDVLKYPNSVYGVLGKTSSVIKRIDGTPQSSWASTSPALTETLILEPGTYWLAAGFPNRDNQLGNQNGASTNHGETTVIIEGGPTPPVLTEKVIRTDSHASSSISFTIDKTVDATLSVYVCRGLNQWTDITRYPNSVFGILGKSSSIIKQLYIYPEYSWPGCSPSFTQTLTLSPGTYWLAAGFPNGSSQLGNQNGASTNHGCTYATLKYYY